MKILFNNEPFESIYYCGVNKYYGILLNKLKADNKLQILEPRFIRNPFIDKEKFKEPVIFQNNKFYKKNFLNFIPKKFRKKIFASLINKNKKLFSKRIKSNDFDILHIDFCESPSLKIVNRIAKYVRKPIIVVMHDLMTSETLPNNADYLKRAHFAPAKIKLLEIASKIIAISEVTKKDLIKYFNIDEKKITVIHNCYEKPDLKNQEEIKLPQKYILYVGKRTGHKNFRFFLNSIREILLQDKDLKLVFTLQDFAGEERSYISCLGLLDSCVFIDASDEKILAVLYKNALCCAIPTLYEGFGMITLEAMNYGCPLVISDLDIMHEVASDAALYFDPLNAESIASSIKKVIYDDKLLDKMKQKSLKRSLDFTVEKMIKNVIKLYNQLNNL